MTNSSKNLHSYLESGCRKSEKSGDVIYDDPFAFYIETAWLRYSATSFAPPQLKVSKFQNEFMKLSFLPKYEQKIV